MFIEDPQIRLLLFDVTLFIGGIRLYNCFVIILLSLLALCLLIKCHLHPHKSLNQVLDFYYVIRGTADKNTFPFLSSYQEQLCGIRKFAIYFNIVSIIVCLALGKLSC